MTTNTEKLLVVGALLKSAAAAQQKEHPPKGDTGILNQLLMLQGAGLAGLGVGESIQNSYDDTLKIRQQLLHNLKGTQLGDHIDASQRSRKPVDSKRYSRTPGQYADLTPKDHALNSLLRNYDDPNYEATKGVHKAWNDALAGTSKSLGIDQSRLGQAAMRFHTGPKPKTPGPLDLDMGREFSSKMPNIKDTLLGPLTTRKNFMTRMKTPMGLVGAGLVSGGAGLYNHLKADK